MKTVLSLALVVAAGCGASQSGTKPGPPRAAAPVVNQAFAMRVEPPAGWKVESIEGSDERFLVRLEQGELILWIGARTTDLAVEPVAALRARGGTKATLKTTWMDLPAAITAAEAAFSEEGGRIESRLLAVRGQCQYEMTISAPRSDAARAHEMLLEFRQQVSGVAGPTPLAALCNPGAEGAAGAPAQGTP